MIPTDHTVKVGQAVIIKASGLLIHAKCSCPGSRPVEHTARYINNHKGLFELAPSGTLDKPAPLTAPSSTA